MTDTPRTTNDDTTNADSTKKWALIAAALAIVAALVAALLPLNTGDDSESINSVNSTSASDTTTVVETTGPATTEVPPLPDASIPAVWPWADSPRALRVRWKRPQVVDDLRGGRRRIAC